MWCECICLIVSNVLIEVIRASCLPLVKTLCLSPLLILHVSSGLTQNQVVSGHFPGQVVGQMDGVHVDVLVAVLAHRLDHLPSDLVARLLTTYSRQARDPTEAPSGPFHRAGGTVLRVSGGFPGFLTFLHTAMRMMMDMIIMGTNVRTAASKATWENRAATGGECSQRSHFTICGSVPVSASFL